MPPATAPMPWWVLPGLAAMVLAIFAGALGAMIAKGNETQITGMVQAIIVLTGTAIGYFFGSSAGSQKKDDVIAASVPAAPAAVVVAPVPPVPPIPGP